MTSETTSHKRVLIAMPQGKTSVSLGVSERAAKVSNSTYSPDAAEQHKTPHLTKGEAATIEGLLNACSEFEAEGNLDNSAIVDRIGMKMMRAFLERNATKSDEP